MKHKSITYPRKGWLRLLPMAALLLTTAFQCEDGMHEPYAWGPQQSKCGERLDVEKGLSSPVVEAGGYRMRYDHGNLRITHVGWTVPCDWHDVTVSVATSDNTIVINECCKGGEANCLCEIDNSFLVMYHVSGTYEFVFQECGREVHRGNYTI